MWQYQHVIITGIYVFTKNVIQIIEYNNCYYVCSKYVWYDVKKYIKPKITLLTKYETWKYN